MFTPLPMQHVTLYLPREGGNETALALARQGVFDPQPSAGDDEFNERPALAYRDTFHAAERRLEKAMAYLEVKRPVVYAEPRVVDDRELGELNSSLQEIWQQCSEHEARTRRLDEQRKRLSQLRGALRRFEALDVDLGMLRQGLHFLDVRIGTVPLKNVARLRQAVSLESYSLTVFMRADNTAHVALAGLAGREQQLRDVLRAASFRPLEIPAEFRDYPAEVRRDLEARAQRLEAQGAALRREASALRRRHAGTLREAARTLVLAAPYAGLSDAAVGRGGLVRMCGWVPSAHLDAVRRALPGHVVLEARPPRPKEWPQVPSALGYPRWLSSFGRLVRNYGVPGYGEVDPTWMLMLTFVLMYGMMFGDAGNGLVIAGVGALLRRWLRGYGGFVIAAGLSSVLFGFMHGTAFGYEMGFEPLWGSPLSAPLTMLQIAIAWGMGFILLATLIRIRNDWVFGRRRAALMEGNGVAGMAFYLLLSYLIFRWVSGQAMAGGWFGLLLLPAGVVLAHAWRCAGGRTAERAMVALVHTYEGLAGYVTQTLSFLRLAAFSLNHAALTLAVFTLAGLAGGAASVAVVVLGNLLILVLEGGIVAVQALRLEYYEGFSRFFGGDGRRYRPLVLTAQGRA